jgi:hypothetical protein
MFYLNTTKKFLSFTVNHGGAGFSSYGSEAKSGHFYYSNNISNPWGNGGTHIGSFDLKTAGSTTFVIGEAADANGTILANQQKYTSMCNLFSAGTLDYHFLTIVIDRPKPSQYINGSCPSSYTFLNGYEHPQVSLTITPYYINSANVLTAGSNISTLYYWASKSINPSADCYSLAANYPYTASFPSNTNNYDAGTNPDYWTLGNIVMPQHGCKAVGPEATPTQAGGRSYYFYGRYPANPVGCVNAALYVVRGTSTPGVSNYWWGTQFTNTGAYPGPSIPSCKITYSNAGTYDAGVATYYSNLTTWNSIFGVSPFGSGTYQCTSNTSPYNGNLYVFPRYMPDVSSRCNQGARTSTQDPYYNGSSYPTYGGYGFFMKFTWDALCYPCA